MITNLGTIWIFLFVDFIIFIYLFCVEEFKVVFSLFWKFILLGIICLLSPCINLVFLSYPIRGLLLILSKPYYGTDLEFYVMVEFLYIIYSCYFCTDYFFIDVSMFGGTQVVLLRGAELVLIFIVYISFVLLDYYSVRNWYIRKQNGLLKYYYYDNSDMSKEEKERRFKKW